MKKWGRMAAPAMPASPRKWPHLITSPKLGVMVLLLMVAAILFLNLEAFFPYTPFSGDDVDERMSSSTSEWPAANYLVSASHPENWLYSDDAQRQSGRMMKLLPGRLPEVEELFLCDRSHPRTDVCYLKGDRVRMHSASASFILHARHATTRLGQQRIKPYTRKWETSCMDIVHEVKVVSINATGMPDQTCEVRHSVPAVVFTTGGYTGNVYHEFHDGLIPLYITSQHLRGEVVFIGVELHNWWLTKYGDVVQQLSNYPVIDFDRDQRVHCFPEVTVGLHIHDELAVHPQLMPHNETIVDFRNVLNTAYSSSSSNNSDDQPASTPVSGGAHRPRLVVIVRNDTRVILNLQQVVEVAERVGFDVELVKPDRTSELKKLYWTLNSSDVLLGVHGAAMTHFLFMRPGSVFIQVIPLGTKWAAATYYGDPAQKLGLHYFGYEITAEESSLSDKYDANSTVLTDPEQVSQKGWWLVKQIYLEGQNVRLSLPRFTKTLLLAKAKALSPSP